MLRARRSHEPASAAPVVSRAARRPSGAYDAFISYSRAVDGKLAPAVQQGLQQFSKPWYRRRALRVFRDDASLSANPGLWSSIQQALDGTPFFVLLASPEAAASKWVDREAEHWLEHNSPDRLLIALTDGEIAWDEENGDFDWSRTTPIPPSVAHAYSEEPRFTELRWARKENHLSLRDPRFRDSIADLASWIRGEEKDELVGEDIRQHRRVVRLSISTIVLLGVLALAAGIAALQAVNQRDTARKQRDLATSRFLAARAISNLDDNLPNALLTSLAALRVKDTAEARSALLAGVQHPVPELTSYLESQSNPVTSVAFSPDGKLLASGDSGGAIVLWSVGRRRSLDLLVRSGAAVGDVAFSPDGSLLATSTRNRITLWSVRDRHRLATLESSAGELVFSRDGKWLVSGGDVITIWDVARRRALKVIGRSIATDPVALSGDGAIIAVGGSEGVDLWDVARKRMVAHLTGFSKSAQTVAFSPDGKTLAAGGFMGQLVLWDADRRQELRSLVGHRDAITSVAFSRDGRRLASTGLDGTIIVWNVRTGRRIRTLTGHTGSVATVAVSPDGDTLASGGDDGTLVLWNLKPRPRLTRRLRLRADGLVFSPDGKRLLTSSGDGEVALWDLLKRRSLGSWTSLSESFENVTPIVFSPNGSAIAGAGNDHIYVWRRAGARALGDPETLPLDLEARALAFNADASKLAVVEGEHPRVDVWDLAHHRRSRTRLTLGADPEQVAFSPDGRTVAGGSFDGKVSLWDVEHRRRLGTFQGHRGGVMSIAFSRDGAIAATGGDKDGRIVVWDVARARRLDRPLIVPGQSTTTLALAPDGRTLVSNGRHNTLIVWDVESRRQLATLPVGQLSGQNVAFSADGATLAVSGDPVVLADMSVTAWQRRACTIVNRNLSREEWNELIGGSYHRVCPAVRS